MAYVILTPNACEPHKAEKIILSRPMTIWEWVLERHPAGEFPSPTICVLNGDAVKREGWGYQIKKGDIVNFITMPAGIETIIAIALTVVVLAVTLAFTLNQPKVPGEQPTSDPVFSTKGQENAIRLGQPIESCYGRNRIYPSYASRPYFEYRDNDQFTFNLFCLGQGEYDIADIQIGDTDINNYTEVQYEVCPPGTPVTLFPTAVYTAAEAGGQTLYAPNNLEYVAPGWVGPFPANPAGTTAHTIQFDVVIPKGLYRQTKSGKPDVAGINFEVEFRPIDDGGAPLGPYVSFTGDPFISLTGTTITPQRRTYMEDVTPGRYEVRARRISDAGLAANFGDELVWDGLRSYLEEEQDFGDVTLLAVIIRATNNLNSQTQQQFNVVATRKLPIRESSGWSDPQPTRSIVWALVDVFRANYGGRITQDMFFDWDTLEELDELYTSRGENFDWVFRDPVTVWEAARAVARCGRAIPLLAGSLLTMKRDGPQSIPVAMFNQENIIKGSFEKSTKLWDLDEFDSVRVEYTEPATGYKQETVLATLPGGTTDHPEDVRFPGIQDRAHAYHEGLYMQAVRQLVRENYTWETGLEGFIPTFGDLVAIRHDVIKGGQGGYVVHAERGAGDVYQLWLSTPLVWADGQDYQVMLRGRKGDLVGPFEATQTDDASQMVIHSVEDLDFLLEGDTEPMLFNFGPTGAIDKYVRVVMIEPLGGEVIRITAATEEPLVHSFDELEPADLNQPAYPPTPPDLPEIAELRVTQLDAALFIIQASWSAAFGAQYYVIQTSEDGVYWRERIQTTRTTIQIQVSPGDLYIRVAGVNKGQGPWIEEHFDVTFVSGLFLSGEWEDLSWEVTWLTVLGATGYTVKVYDNSASAPVLKRTATVVAGPYEYDYDMAVADGNEVREMLVTVEPIFPPETEGETPATITPAELELLNTIPEEPQNPGSEESSVESMSVFYRVFWDAPTEEDLIRVKVWLSDINGFDPTMVSPVVDELVSFPGAAGIPTEAFLEVMLDSAGEHPAQYWRVAFFDVWGDEISTNITTQQTIPAFS